MRAFDRPRLVDPRVRLLLRLVAPVLLVLGLVLALFNSQVPRVVHAEVLAQGLSSQQVLADQLVRAYENAGPGEDPVEEARELLRQADAAPEVTQTCLADARGLVVAAARRAGAMGTACR